MPSTVSGARLAMVTFLGEAGVGYSLGPESATLRRNFRASASSVKT